MKKVFFVIAIIGIILCGCGRTQEESIKTESSDTQNDNGVRIQSCELPYDGDKEMYIDSVYLQDKLQVLSLAMENDDFVLKRSVMSEVGVWEEHKEELDGEIKKHIGISDDDVAYITKIHKESEDTLFALWQQCKLVNNEDDDSLTRTYVKFGIMKIDVQTWEMKMLWTNDMDEKDANAGVTDFGITDVGDFMLYFGQQQKIVNYNSQGEAKAEFDMKNSFSGVAQFNGDDIWALSKETKAITRYSYAEGKVEKQSSIPFEMEENAQMWKIFGDLDEKLYFFDKGELYIVKESKELEKVFPNEKLPVAFTDYVNSDTESKSYLIGPKVIDGGEKKNDNSIQLHVYVIV